MTEPRPPALVFVFALLAIAAPAVATPEDRPLSGGTPTQRDQFPNVVDIEVSDGICTGIVIAPEWVLTAGHCVTPYVVGLATQDELIRSIRIHVGTVNVAVDPGTVLAAIDAIPDPAFVCTASACPQDGFDAGLIRLKSPSRVLPAPVNFDPAKAPVGIAVTEVGFGRADAGTLDSWGVERALHQSSISCAGRVQDASDTQLLCYDQPDGGKCPGDSGGPSFAMIDGLLTVVGLTSWGEATCSGLGVDSRTDTEQAFVAAHVPTVNCARDGDCEQPGGGCSGSGGTPALATGLAIVALASRLRSARCTKRARQPGS